MISKYGDFTNEQLAEYRDKLHRKLFWLLLYKDPNTKDAFVAINFDNYFTSLMCELNGLNDILMCPNGMVEMLSVLEAAYKESNNENFNYRLYRKFVLDAHNLLDKMDWEVEEDD